MDSVKFKTNETNIQGQSLIDLIFAHIRSDIETSLYQSQIQLSGLQLKKGIDLQGYTLQGKWKYFNNFKISLNIGATDPDTPLFCC